jgi:hypothetical protein
LWTDCEEPREIWGYGGMLDTTCIFMRAEL